VRLDSPGDISWHKDEYDGRLAQITDIFSRKSESPTDRAKHHRNKGCARAVLIKAEYRETRIVRDTGTRKGCQPPNSALKAHNRDFFVSTVIFITENIGLSRLFGEIGEGLVSPRIFDRHFGNHANGNLLYK